MSLQKFDDAVHLMKDILDSAVEFPAKFKHEDKEYVITPSDHHEKAVSHLTNAITDFKKLVGIHQDEDE